MSVWNTQWDKAVVICKLVLLLLFSYFKNFILSYILQHFYLIVRLAYNKYKHICDKYVVYLYSEGHRQLNIVGI